MSFEKKVGKIHGLALHIIVNQAIPNANSADEDNHTRDVLTPFSTPIDVFLDTHDRLCQNRLCGAQRGGGIVHTV